MPDSQKPKFVIKTVTPRALKVYREAGLLNFNSQDLIYGEKMMDVYCNTETLEKIIAVTFEKKFEPDQIEDVDLGMVSRGIRDFLAQLSDGL
ncbi:MAG: hypothetical protein PHC43_08475 [Candidatus Marinimicrobia bacterium]|jgi:hypothetical protein|nr:hypothetical protein [Candidatus Neomarinimicrobiota bacterium]MDD5539493.1 hypothetical protein [Candidatus Neomarinimicrobiota bacterium]